MRRIVRRRPSPSMVVALLALFVALSGTTYAASKLAKNSVGSKQIKKGAVGNTKIKRGAVTGSKIKKNAITASKIKSGAVTGADIKLSTLGTVPKATDATRLGGRPAGAFQARWLVVKGTTAGATVLDSSGGFTVQRGTVPGYYLIGTGSSVAKKSLQVSPSLGDGTFRQAQISPCGDVPGGFICDALSPGTDDGQHVVVRMTEGNGSTVADGTALVAIGG